MYINQHKQDSAAMTGSFTSVEVINSREDMPVSPPLSYADKQKQETLQLRDQPKDLGSIAVNWSGLTLDEVNVILKNQGDCGGANPKRFYPNQEASTTAKSDERAAAAAKEICRDCAVRINCFEYAIENGEEYGIWGGTTERERRLILKRHRAQAAA